MSQGKFSNPRPHREEEREIEKAYRDLTRKQSHKTYEHRVTAEDMDRRKERLKNGRLRAALNALTAPAEPRRKPKDRRKRG